VCVGHETRSRPRLLSAPGLAWIQVFPGSLGFYYSDTLHAGFVFSDKRMHRSISCALVFGLFHLACGNAESTGSPLSQNGAGTGGSNGGGSAGRGNAGQDLGGTSSMTDGGASGGSVAAEAGAAGAPIISQTPPYDVGVGSRGKCVFGPGDLTTKTVGPNVPHGDQLPFKHVIVLMLENRSFDHYFSKLPEYGVTDVDVAPDDAYNYDTSLRPPAKVERYHEKRYCIQDTNHEWGGVHLQYDGGSMSGFVTTNAPGGQRAMGYYDATDLPYFYWLAKTFAISDRHFCSVLGPTWPNRFYFYGATSWGNTKTGDLGAIQAFGKRGRTILDQMQDGGRSWKIYRDGLAAFALTFGLNYSGVPMSEFEADANGNKLPDLAIIDPNFSGAAQNDDHPPANVQRGQILVARVLNFLMERPKVWENSVFIVLYDEHGGFYDHVPPPSACEPDSFVPEDHKFDRLGVRTPLIVASPFAKRGYVSHIVTDITSVTRFIQNRFDLPALTMRDANAWPMLDLFDFESAPHKEPPTGAPQADLDAEAEEWCQSNPPGTGLP
jgi:phospholipase C